MLKLTKSLFYCGCILLKYKKLPHVKVGSHFLYSIDQAYLVAFAVHVFPLWL